MSWLSYLPKMAQFGPPRITVGVTEKTARKALKIKAAEPIVWRGIPLNCIGSARWRRRVLGLAKYPPSGPNVVCAGCGKRTSLTKAVCDRCIELAGGVPTSTPEAK